VNDFGFLNVLLGLPILLALLILPFIIIVVPFRWRSQSKRLKGIENRLLQLEGRFEDFRTRIRSTPTHEAEPSASTPAVEAPASSTDVPEIEHDLGIQGAAEHRREPASGSLVTKPEATATQAALLAPPAGAPPLKRLRLAVVDPDWERLFGTRWLSVVGIVVFVVGVVLFIGYSLRYMGPLGRVATGFGVGALLLGAGWLLERIETYRIMGRALLGGGWALAYFTAYAAHNLEMARVIDDPTWGLGLLGVVALAMIGHSFHYRSERVTGLGYGLAFLAIAISPISDASLFATGLLGVSLVAVLWVMPWYLLGTLGVLATYACFALWYELRAATIPIVAETNFLLGMGMLAFYWLAFSLAQFLRRPATAGERDLLLTLAAVNCGGFLALGILLVQRAHADEMYMFTTVSAVAFAGLSWMLRRGNLRGPFLLHALAAIALTSASIPLLLRNAGVDYDWLALPWAALSAIVLTAGLRLHELWIRVAGYLLSGLVVVAIVAINMWGEPPDAHLVGWLTMPPIIAFFFVVFEVLKARAGHSDVLEQAREVGLAFGYLATALLAGFVWEEAPERLVGILWVVTGAFLLEVGWRTGRPHVRLQGLLLAGAGLVPLLLVNLYDVLGSEPLQLPRWVLVAAAVGVYYGIYLRTRTAPDTWTTLPAESVMTQGAAYAGTALLALLLWFELDSVSLAVFWALQGLVLFELGGRLQSQPLRLSGHVMAVVAFSRLFVANFTALGVAGLFSHRLISVLPVMAILCYLDFALREEARRNVWTGPAGRPMHVFYTYASVITLVILLRFELGRDVTVVAWAPLALGLLALGRYMRDPHLRIQAYALSVLSFARSWATNLTLAGSFFGLPERILTTSAVIATFIAAAGFTLGWARQGTAAPASDIVGRLDARAHQLFGLLAAALLAVLLAHEVDPEWVTAAWGIEAFIVLAIGFVLVERSYRMFGLVLLLLCLLKLVVYDLRDVETIYRILTSIILGICLLLASLIYTRYQDAIRRYL